MQRRAFLQQCLGLAAAAAVGGPIVAAAAPAVVSLYGPSRLNLRRLLQLQEIRKTTEDLALRYVQPPKFIGREFTLEDVFLYVERKSFMLEFYAYETMNAAILSPGAREMLAGTTI